MDIFEKLKNDIRGKKVKIVFPEGNDERVLRAAVRLKANKLVEPIVIGEQMPIEILANERGLTASNLTIIDPEDYKNFDKMVEVFVERRNGRVTEDQARTILKDHNYFGTMLTYMGEADGMVSGAIHTTGDTVRPALQIIKTKPGISRTSGAFFMDGERSHEQYIFADCAINLDPSAQELAEIAIESAKTAKMFGVDPKVAMLSYSSKGSAQGEAVDKVVEATKLVKEQAPNLPVDGELQFDAAFVSTVGQEKAPGSEVAGQATVFVFPEIQSGNIGYKIAQRFGGFDAIGPILQGLNKPVSDLSRGCNEEEVYKLTIITAAQALMED